MILFFSNIRTRTYGLMHSLRPITYTSLCKDTFLMLLIMTTIFITTASQFQQKQV